MPMKPEGGHLVQIVTNLLSVGPLVSVIRHQNRRTFWISRKCFLQNGQALVSHQIDAQIPLTRFWLLNATVEWCM